MNKKALFVLIPLFLLVAAPSVYFYAKYQKVSEELKKMSPESKEDVAILLQKVGELMELPKDEEPTVATVTDKEKLKEQKFFMNAENQDKVIIYVKAQKAILYRPSWNKIIEVARVDSTNQSLSGENSGIATSSSVVAPTIAPINLVVLNGTEKSGLSNVFVEKIKDIGEAKVVQKLVASKKDYVGSLVVDLGRENGELAKKIISTLGVGEIVYQMPEGEATPSSKLVVILGSDFVN